MRIIIAIITSFVVFSCSSNGNRQPKIEPDPNPRSIDLLESFKMNAADSVDFLTNWRSFISDLGSIDDKSLPLVECWSANDFQNGDYSLHDSVPIDSCKIRHLFPLKETSIWPVLHTDNYDLEILKLQSEKIGKYNISFPRDTLKDPNYHPFKHFFAFKKIKGKFIFSGYCYN